MFPKLYFAFWETESRMDKRAFFGGEGGTLAITRFASERNASLILGLLSCLEVSLWGASLKDTHGGGCRVRQIPRETWCFMASVPLAPVHGDWECVSCGHELSGLYWKELRELFKKIPVSVE